MTDRSSSFAPRLLAGVGTAALVGGVGLFASSRPAHTAGGPIPVAVTNTTLTTMPADVAAPTQPFQHTFGVGNLAVRASGSITVPAHKRLVIEYVSASLNQFEPGVGGFVDLQTQAGGETVYYYLTDQIQDFRKRSQSVRIYADPGTTVRVEAVNNDFATHEIGTDTEISGYYVNVP